MIRNKVIALIGRVNVGKSSIFNGLLRRKRSIIHDRPGVTRDCKYELWARTETMTIHIVDTPGYYHNINSLDKKDAIKEQDVVAQILGLAQTADVLVYIMDASSGITQEDRILLKHCYKTAKPIIAVANKIDIDKNDYQHDVYKIDSERKLFTNALHKQGLDKLKNNILEEIELEDKVNTHHHKSNIQNTIAIVGKPNVGKSTLINALLNNEVAITSATAGTTRDSTQHTLKWGEEEINIIDTAGIRRRTKINDNVEKESVIQVFNAIRAEAALVLFVVDAEEMITDQDKRLIRTILDSRKKIIIVFNKYDKITRENKKKWQEEIQYQLKNNKYIEAAYTTATKNKGIDRMMEKVIESIQKNDSHTTSYMTKILQTAIEVHTPPMVANRRIKPKFAHQSKNDNYTIIIQGNLLSKAPKSYLKYLASYYQKTLNITGIDIRIEIRESINPYKK